MNLVAYPVLFMQLDRRIADSLAEREGFELSVPVVKLRDDVQM
jgi:hypothetical protein